MSRRSDPVRRFAPPGGFVFRSPLLPADVLDGLPTGTAAAAYRAGATDADLEAAIAAERAELAGALRTVVADPAVREAIYVASPSLASAVADWVGGKDDDAVLRTVLAYVARMSSRCTPFGLFAGVGAGGVGDEFALDLPDRSGVRRHTRLDYGYLAEVVAHVEANPAYRDALTLVPNTSLYRAGGRLRLAERRIDGAQVRYHRVAVEEDEALTAVLEAAAGGADRETLAKTLTDDEITVEEAREYVDVLVDNQLLTSDLGPPITGGDALADLAARLDRDETTRPLAAALGAAREAMAELDRAGAGADPARYQQIADRLEPVGTEIDVARLFQVDLTKPGGGAALSRDVVAEILRGIEVLYQIFPDVGDDDLATFRSAFTDRYEDREVPLVLALDEELGIGFGSAGGPGVEGAPLLAGLPGVPDPAGTGVAWRSRDRRLLELVLEAAASGATEIRLTTDDVQAMERADPPPPPDALIAMATVAAPSAAAVRAGEYAVAVNSAFGPSGAQMLGRFCHTDPAILAVVRDLLAAEERHRPDAVYAEVVHLPQGRIGNILARPVLRRHEIAFLGRSGADPDDQLVVDDLMVSVRGGRVVLRSARLGREVVPRLTSAHNFRRGALAVYRFLAAMQYDGVAGALQWRWGPLDAAPYLPRVSYGRCVLARARWRLTTAELKPVVSATAAAQRFRALQQLRETRGLPRFAVISEGDNELPVDLDQALGPELVARQARRSGPLLLVERHPGPDELCARGPDGAYTHEIALPLARPAPEAHPEARPEARPLPVRLATAAPAADAFAPGAEWLMAKVYTGRAAADRLLRELVPAVLDRAGHDGWFFIRYGDPEWHLRLRLHGDRPGALLAALHEASEPFVADGTIWRIQLDTYRREVDRYGGPEGIVLAERLFQADSEAVLAALRSLDGDEALADRWRLAVAGVDRFLGDLGFDVPRRRDVVRRWRDGLVTEYGETGTLARQLAGRVMRRDREPLTALMAGEPPTPGLVAGLRALDQRSAAMAPALAALHELAAAGRLTQPLDVLAMSYDHMFVNRLLRGAARLQELVVHDLLDRLYGARLARS